LSDGAFAGGDLGDFGARGENAEGGVDDDLFHGLGFGGGFGQGLGSVFVLREIEAGDLKAVEEEAGAARVDFVGGDALQDLADGGLDGGAVFGEWQVEGGAAAAGPARIGDRAASGVVVVTELFLTEAGAGAAAAVSEDVAALILFGCFGCVLHGPSPRGTFLCKVFETEEMSLDFEVRRFPSCG
jgi:hypothetical protein